MTAMRILIALVVFLSAQAPVIPPAPPPPPAFPPLAIVNGVETDGTAIPQNGEGVIRGVVRRVDTGQGLRGVAIRLSTRGTAPRSLTTTTDATGSYEFLKLPFDSYTVSSTLEGFFVPSPNDIPVTVGMNAATLDALHRTVLIATDFTSGGVISGAVQNARGTPVPNVPVTALRTSYRKGVKALTPAKTINTDDKGEFRIVGLAPAEYYVRADAPSVPVDPSVTTRVASFTLRTTSNAAGGNLMATPASFSPTYAPSGAVAANGVSYRIKGGDEFTARIVLSENAPIRISGTVTNTTPAATDTLIGFLLMPRNSDFDEGIEGILLQNVAADKSGGKFEIVTTRSGLYDLVAVAATIYPRQIGVRTANALGFKAGKALIDVRDRNIADVQIEIVPGVDMEVRFRTPGGAEVRQVGYLLRSRDASDTTMLIDDTGAIVNPDGRTYMSVAMTGSRTFSRLPQGEYQFEFPLKPAGVYISDMKQGGRSIYAEGIATVGKTSAEPIDVIFSPGGASVRGNITGGEISAVRPARVTLVPQGARRNNPLFYVRATSTDGTFNLTGIAPGQYRLFAFASLPISADESVAFTEPYEISGRAIVVDVNSSIANIELPLLRSAR